MSKESALSMLSGSIAQPSPTPAPTDPVAPEPVSATEASPDVRMDHLFKKESQLVKEREALKAEQATHAKEKETLKSIQTKIQQFEDMRVSDPVAALQGLGFSETDIFNFLSKAEEAKADPVTQAQKAAAAEIQKFRDEQAKLQADTKALQTERVLTQFKSDITAQVKSDPDKYEWLNFHGPLAEELIYDTVAEVLNDSGEVISVQEAAERVEAYYEEQDKRAAALKKRAGASKVVSAPADPIVSVRTEAPNAYRAPSRTLSNKVAPSVASTVTKVETRDQKRERLMDQLKQGLKK